ncbi:hypothetical protein CY34DRAFT_490151 [Suillus luteus UH-Slu-Lm8-n1]|uniref:Uncharacterized protein n=1 Tax=Suillus luteus UH-Slu-Lm8-n1 TaxID=930992 RepID=A0A0C9ZHJ3_9AGAM|nr:hypothetical protein CY34DRAFT_490151 [Suillus luteus UH-Slu-Lm8-n1]
MYSKWCASRSSSKQKSLRKCQLLPGLDWILSTTFIWRSWSSISPFRQCAELIVQHTMQCLLYDKISITRAGVVTHK